MTQGPTSLSPAPARKRIAKDGRTAEEPAPETTSTPRPLSFPRFRDKYSEASITSPQAFADQPLETVPRTAILCYTKFTEVAIEAVLRAYTNSRESKVIPGVYFLSDSLALVKNHAFLGAPMASVHLERLIQLGVRSFVVLGIAGSLREETGIGQVVVCDRAVRDEGTSHHYLPSSEYAWPAPEMPQRLAAFLRERGMDVQIGGTWTTDAIFRETALEVRHLAREGIFTVEMEAAALFSVAQFRGVQLGAVFVVSDLVHREQWERDQDGCVLADALTRVLGHLVQFDHGSQFEQRHEGAAIGRPSTAEAPLASWLPDEEGSSVAAGPLYAAATDRAAVVYKVIAARRSIRKYRPQPVEPEKLARILEAARLAPSARNKQPWHYVVVTDPEIRDRLRRAYDHEWFYHAPIILCACGEPSRNPANANCRDYRDIHVTISLDHLILAASAEGLGTCWVGAFNPVVVREELGIPAGIEPILMTPLGYPDEKPAARGRRPLADVIHHERWSDG